MAAAFTAFGIKARSASSGLPKAHWYSLRRMTYPEYQASLAKEHETLVDNIVRTMKERNEMSDQSRMYDDMKDQASILGDQRTTVTVKTIPRPEQGDPAYIAAMQQGAAPKECPPLPPRQDEDQSNTHRSQMWGRKPQGPLAATYPPMAPAFVDMNKVEAEQKGPFYIGSGIPSEAYKVVRCIITDEEQMNARMPFGYLLGKLRDCGFKFRKYHSHSQDILDHLDGEVWVHRSHDERSVTYTQRVQE